jgi:hypothetical protein
MKLLTWDPTKKKQVLVGNIIGNTIYREVESIHFMRILNGYGMQEVAFQEVIEKGVKYIVEKVLPTGEMWRSTVADWIEHGSKQNYGHGTQRFLSLKYMHKWTKFINADIVPSINISVKSRLADEFFRQHPELRRKHE